MGLSDLDALFFLLPGEFGPRVEKLFATATQYGIVNIEEVTCTLPISILSFPIAKSLGVPLLLLVRYSCHMLLESFVAGTTTSAIQGYRSCNVHIQQ